MALKNYVKRGTWLQHCGFDVLKGCKAQLEVEDVNSGFLLPLVGDEGYVESWLDIL